MRVFFPSCKITAGYPESSRKLREYMEKRHGLTGIGCCKEFGPKLEAEDTPVLICNNCAMEMRSRGIRNTPEFVPELIDRDETFAFPDYEGITCPVQDCRHGYEKDMMPIVKSLLGKMNIHADESADPEVVPGDLPYPEHAAIVHKNAAKMTGERIVTFCPICNLTYRQAGKKPLFLLDLLFDTAGE